MAKRRAWSRKETLAALYLYLTLPARMLDDTGEEVRTLARAIGRTPGAVSLKIHNIASHDEGRIRQGKKGMSHASKLDKMIWDEYSADCVSLVDEATAAYEEEMLSSGPVDIEFRGSFEGSLLEGGVRESTVSQRVNQRIFRNSLLANYRSRCCLTGLSNERLLVASHIKPWAVSDPKTERLAPDNGLLLNALHDRAFDQGLITLDRGYRIVVSKKVPHETPENEYLWRYNGEQITLPRVLPPRTDFIEYHNDVIFQG